jgi:hypothetical protein
MLAVDAASSSNRRDEPEAWGRIGIEFRMPNQAQPSRRSRRSTWVPSDVATPKDSGPARRKSRSGDADQWLPLPKRRSKRTGNRIAADVGSNGNVPDGDAADATPAKSRPKRPKVPKRASPRERWLLVRLRRSQRRVGEQKEEIEELKTRVRELERASEARARPASKRTGTGGSKATNRKPRASGRGASKGGGRAAKPAGSASGKRANSRRA